jgi:hypothetical protein
MAQINGTIFTQMIQKYHTNKPNTPKTHVFYCLFGNFDLSSWFGSWPGVFENSEFAYMNAKVKVFYLFTRTFFFFSFTAQTSNHATVLNLTISLSVVNLIKKSYMCT